MNKNELLELLNPYIQEIIGLEDFLTFEDVSIHLDLAKAGQIIFYFLEEGKEDKFLKRFKEGDFLLVVNKIPKDLKNPQNLILIEKLCTHYEVELSFIKDLSNVGLIEIVVIDQTQFIHQDKLSVHREMM